jgi:alkylation response protein AidB-like acyl-CoA dehydrogenase
VSVVTDSSRESERERPASGASFRVEDSPEEAAFRAEARAFFESVAQLRTDDDETGNYFAMADDDPATHVRHVERCRDWQRCLHDAGWAGITVPPEYGGRGGERWQERIFRQEQSRYTVDTGLFAVGLGMVVPTILVHGTEEQKQRYIPPLLRGDEIWCQLFSEPGAGSDLAGLSTRAIRDGDEWVVNGQKVWNSGAHHAELGALIARTDVDAPKHRGITYFLVDMHTPGVDVRPLRQATGVAHFNEVFLTDVRIPNANVLGAVNGGWSVAQTMLMNERNMIGSGGMGIGFGDYLRMARDLGVTDDPAIRQALAACFVRTEVIKYLGARAQAAIRAGKQPGPETSVVKLNASLHSALNGDLGLQIQGAGGMLARDDAYRRGMFQQLFVGQWGMRLGGGTEQIQRNVIGERVLGLPGEPRTDKTLPFKDLLRNG